jgi:hypothetical protein
MGIASEWLRVLVLSVVYFGIALSWEAIKSKSFAEFLESLPGWFLTGALWAMMMVFEWRVLRGGISAVFAILLVALFAVGLSQRRARKRREASAAVR